MVVAIDGPAGAGKSTVAKAVARRLGFSFLDTGALYRASALRARKLGLAFEESPQMRAMMESIRIAFEDGRVLLEGEDVTEAIRTPEVSQWASVISAIPVVRELLLPLQRRIGRDQDLVAEGRDMGTVVFPDTPCKFFIDASNEERARRRYRELLEKGISVKMEDVLKEMNERDLRDSSRAVAPLAKAEDAEYILTDHLTVDEVVDRIVDRVKEVLGRVDRCGGGG